jgi:hypothetical protein
MRSPALSFARSLLARWDRRVISPGPLGLLFLRAPEARRATQGDSLTTVNVDRSVHVRSDMHLRLNPRISLVLVRNATAPAAGAAGPATPQSVRNLVLRDTTALRTERLLTRLLDRGVRVEGAPAPRPGAAAPAASSPLASPRAGLVMRRGEAPDEPAPGRARPAAYGDPGPLTPPSADPAPPPSAVDVGRLTDQVLSAIDHRIVAHSERLGRP